MINWSVDEKKFKKKHPKEYKLWRLTQLINYGLDGEKLDEKEVKKAWPKIKEKIDKYKRVLFEFLLFDRHVKSQKDWISVKDPKLKELIEKCPMCSYDFAMESLDPKEREKLLNPQTLIFE